MSALTPEQQSVVDAPMVPLCVIACAGSGKTKTAVHRLVALRRNLGEARGRIALLSFSNIAVDTFRKAYNELAIGLPPSAVRSRVDIDTLDGFITRNIVRPHCHRIMRSPRAAFLVTGGEAFLDGFKFPATLFPRSIRILNLAFIDGEEVFFFTYNDQIEIVDSASALKLVAKLGRTGAYTHELGRYWAYRTLLEEPKLLAVMARRYPHIMIDEAQDIGSVHKAILDLLIGAGSCVTLVGDPNQAIYEFAGADGRFLADFQLKEGVEQKLLTRNFRSTPAIVEVANCLCGRGDAAERAAPEVPHGAFFLGHKLNELSKVIDAFLTAIEASGADIKRSAVLCRSKSLVEKLKGDHILMGQGLVKSFAMAAKLRDQHADFTSAFRYVATAVIALLENPPVDLFGKITQPSGDALARELRKVIWAFTRDAQSGLPSSMLVADAQWHPLLVQRVKALLNSIFASFGLKYTDKVGNKLAKTSLPSTPLLSAENNFSSSTSIIRIDTVHKAKGESLDAVLYFATRDQARALLDGVNTEVGRIGYVAVTRARDLLWVAIPHTCVNELRPELMDKGFKETVISST
jgi:superfamily I DNA/RNA helicase